MSQGTLKYHNGNLKYIGRVENGKPHGQGTLYGINGTILYEGSFDNGVYEGFGTLRFADTEQVLYIGCFSEGSYHGDGKLYSKKKNPEDGVYLKYDGEFDAYKCNGNYNGYGTLYYPNGNKKYVGTFRNGEFYGSGTMYHESGSVKNIANRILPPMHGIGYVQDGIFTEYYENGNTKSDLIYKGYAPFSGNTYREDGSPLCSYQDGIVYGYHDNGSLKLVRCVTNVTYHERKPGFWYDKYRGRYVGQTDDSTGRPYGYGTIYYHLNDCDSLTGHFDDGDPHGICQLKMGEVLLVGNYVDGKVDDSGYTHYTTAGIKLE